MLVYSTNVYNLIRPSKNNSLFLIKFRNYFSFQKRKDVMYSMSYKLVHAVVLSNDSLYVFVLVYIS